MKLTQEQIDYLYEFTRQHYVEYYDLQTELVDHLANSIEEQWLENPKLSFETALNVEFKKFGIFGFMDVVGQRRLALKKKYNNLIWKHLKEFFTIPKIIVTLIMVLILDYLIQSYGIVLPLFLILIAFLFMGITYMFIKNKIQFKKTGKKWLFKDIVFGYSSFTSIFCIQLQFISRIDESTTFSFFWTLFFSVLITSFGLLQYIICIEIPSKAEEYLKQTYPEYNLQNL
jgi:hypothetical protein